MSATRAHELEREGENLHGTRYAAPMSTSLRALLCALSFVLAGSFALASSLAPAPQARGDRFTLYELGEAASGSFAITYDVTATQVGARRYWNSVRSGSEVSAVRVQDRASGRTLTHRIVDGASAREGGHANARPEGVYIEVDLPRPVPALGGVRLRIEKTYVDPASYRLEGEELVFERTLSIERNRVVLPAGFELIEANHPVQLSELPGSRLALSFVRRDAQSVPLLLRARRLPRGTPVRPPEDPSAQLGSPPELSATNTRDDYSFDDRALDERDIVYFLRDPATHAFRLYHDFTERRAGRDRYLNVVRAGSRAYDPEAWNLDTGERLLVQKLRGTEITEAGVDLGREVEHDTEVVVAHFDPVPEGGSARIRIEETYVDPSRYGMRGDELVWNRRFGRARNAVVLPPDWSLTACSIPGRVSLEDDGRVRVDFVNPRPDRILVLLKARRRPASAEEGR